MARASVAPRHRAPANRRMDRRTHLRHLLNRGCWRRSDGAHKLHLHRRRHRCGAARGPDGAGRFLGHQSRKAREEDWLGTPGDQLRGAGLVHHQRDHSSRLPWRPRVSSAQFALTIVGVILLAISGYLGGYMVYDHGTGIARMSRKKWRHIAERGNAQISPPQRRAT